MSIFGAAFGRDFGSIFGLFGGSAIVEAAEEETATCQLALSRLRSQFADKPAIRAWVCALATPAQAIEDALQDLLSNRAIDTGEGVQLNIIGKIVGQSRNGLSDDGYRPYLRARIATNRSRGITEDLIKIARLLINDALASVVIDNSGTAAVDVRIATVVLTEAIKQALLTFLQQGASAGVRVLLETLTEIDDDTLFTSLSAFTTPASISAGSSSIAVDSTAGFPASGTIKVAAADPTSGVEETLPYKSKLATSFALDGVTTAFNHVQNTDVQLVGEPGRAFGLAAFTTPASISAGSSSLTVDSTTGFPSSGTIQVGYGDPTSGQSEVCTYSSKTSTTFTLVGTTAVTHLQNTACVLADASANAGGALADVRSLYQSLP